MSNKALGVGSRGTIQHSASPRRVLYGPLDPTLCALLIIQHSCPCFNYYILHAHLQASVWLQDLVARPIILWDGDWRMVTMSQ